MNCSKLSSAAVSTYKPLSPPHILTESFYDRDPVFAARDLLGKLLVHQTDDGDIAGRIVETEAYLAENDSACHASSGIKPKNSAMFGPPGKAYVYSIHARWCFNTVTEAVNTACAVLIRAVEPLKGIDLMQHRRGKEKKIIDLTNGPAKLCEAFGIDKNLNEWDLSSGKKLWIEDDGFEIIENDIGVSPRIGVKSARELPLRFYIAEHPFVSGPRRLRVRRVESIDPPIR